MENETKEAAAGDGKRITLEANTNLEGGPCGFCGEECHPDGWDFFIEDTTKLVCMNCVKAKAPDLYLIHRDAHHWKEDGTRAAYKEGARAGAQDAARVILCAISEEPIDRVRRVCREQFGACDDVPF